MYVKITRLEKPKQFFNKKKDKFGGLVLYDFKIIIELQ